jgi:hypothetical protein
VTRAPQHKWDGRATAYAQTFAGQCAHAIEPLLDALDPSAGEILLDVGTGAGAVAAAAPGPAGREAMRAAYDRLSSQLLGPDGLLHLRGAAVLATASRS